MLQEKPAPSLPDDTQLRLERASGFPDLDHRPAKEQIPAVPALELKRGGRKPLPLVHGTSAGHHKGCRDDCPADPSCRQAETQRQREAQQRELTGWRAFEPRTSGPTSRRRHGASRKTKTRLALGLCGGRGSYVVCTGALWP